MELTLTLEKRLGYRRFTQASFLQNFVVHQMARITNNKQIERRSDAEVSSAGIHDGIQGTGSCGAHIGPSRICQGCAPRMHGASGRWRSGRQKRRLISSNVSTFLQPRMATLKAWPRTAQVSCNTGYAVSRRAGSWHATHARKPGAVMPGRACNQGVCWWQAVTPDARLRTGWPAFGAILSGDASNAAGSHYARTRPRSRTYKSGW